MGSKSSYSPVILVANVDVTPGGVLSVPDVSRLKNRDRKPYWLQEIRFSVGDSSTTSVGGLPVSDIIPASCWVKLTLGRQPITKGFVPVWLLAQQINSYVNNGNIGLMRASNNYLTFRLPKPLYIPGGETVSPEFYFNPIYSNGFAVTSPLRIRVAYYGRCFDPSFDKKPSKIQIPYVAAFTPPGFDPTLTIPQIVTSKAQDLANSTREPLKLSHMMGRILEPSHADGNEVVHTSLYTTVKMFDNRGNIAMRDPGRFDQVFSNADSFCWRAKSTMPSQTYFTAQIGLAPGSQFVKAGAISYPMISIIGHRDVVLQDQN